MKPRVFTMDELVSLLPKLNTDRMSALRIGQENGISRVYIDMLRTLLGYSKEKAPNRSPEQVQKVIEVYNSHPGMTAYQVFQNFNDEMGLSDYQSLYTILRKNGVETNRNKDFWTTVKTKRLLWARDVQHMMFKDIAVLLGRSKYSVIQKYYKIKEKEKNEKAKGSDK